MAITQPSVQMCFFLRVDHEFWSEALIASQLSKISKLVKDRKIDILTTEGAVSIKYNDEELLGIEFWDVITEIHPRPNWLLAGERQDIYLAYQTFGIALIPQGEKLRYIAKSATPNRLWHIERSLPLDLFVKEWTTMYFRFNRLLAFLGSMRAQRVVEEWDIYMSPQWKSLIGENTLKHLSQTNLANLLIESGCTGYFVYTEDNGFKYVA